MQAVARGDRAAPPRRTTVHRGVRADAEADPRVRHERCCSTARGEPERAARRARESWQGDRGGAAGVRAGTRRFPDDDSTGTKRKAKATDQARAYQARHETGAAPNEPATREPVQRLPNWVFELLHK